MEEQLLLVINGPRLCKVRLDTWKWKKDEYEIFPVKSAYNTLQETLEGEENK